MRYRYVSRRKRSEHLDDDQKTYTVIEMEERILVGWIPLNRRRARWLAGRLMKFVNREGGSDGRA